MAGSLRETKNRIQGTKKTSQITKAMYMVSASKLKRSERKTLDYTPFMDKVYEIVRNVLKASNGEVEHKMLSHREVKSRGVVLLTSDRGLAGSYNSSICKTLKRDIHESQLPTKVLAFGQKGFSYCKQNGFELIHEESIEVNDELIFSDIIEPIRQMITLFEEGQIDEIVVYYNHFVNTMTQENRTLKLLPIGGDKEEDEKEVQYDYEQSPQELVNILLPTYIENTIFGLLLNSKTSEHASRMTAMKSATDNADKVMGELQVVYNRARQAAITLELTDIVGGANAVK